MKVTVHTRLNSELLYFLSAFVMAIVMASTLASLKPIAPHAGKTGPTGMKIAGSATGWTGRDAQFENGS
ncbi:MAG TPA: hypothetical protein VK862_20160 [Afifellaceae bacterium]|nr:hypothetical protein [Afifellaceae bacterium]